jgi:hypothetical protein
MDNYHYLGSGRICGAQIRYLINTSNYGYIGGLSFSSGQFALTDRDSYIGWSERARRENLKYVVLNNRFLIVPKVRVKNLASHILSKSIEVLAEDWLRRYKVRPLVVETFVNPREYTGTSYKAANWKRVGKSSGRRDGIEKEIYLYGLVRNWRKRLCDASEVKLCEQQISEEPSNWAQEEFGRTRIEDERIKKRLYEVAESFYNRPLANIPEACGSQAKSKGAYRLFSNKKVTMEVILTPHTESTIGRIRNYKVVLAPQDTTTLNYSTHPATEALGPINHQDHDAMGMILHDTIAFSEDGTPLGVLDGQCWVRDKEQRGKSQRRKSLPVENKESYKWLRSFQKLKDIQKHCPETMLISIADREADIYELFLEASLPTPKGTGGQAVQENMPKLLVRMTKARNRKVRQTVAGTSEPGGDKDIEATEHLWEFMERQPLSGTLKIHIPKREGRSAGDAIVDVRFSQVRINPPQNTAYPVLENFWAVYLVETDKTASAVEWMLLTTVPIDSFEDAKKCIEWYSGRWAIELYHRTLKSGCRIKDRQLGTASNLQTCLGVDMVVAWRIYHLTMLGREVPNHPCTVFFEDVEWKALCCYFYKTRIPPSEPPTLLEATRMVGSIGGHLGRKADGMPGTQCIWRGLQRLDTAVEMYIIFTGEPQPKIRSSYPEALTYMDDNRPP